MNVSADGVVEEVRFAMSHRDQGDLVDGVKKAISKEMVRLDPGLKIEHTSYFNHSYNPDLIAIWHEQGVRKARPIYLRGSLSSVLDSTDVPALSYQEPVLIGLREESTPVLQTLRARIPRSSGALATQVSSVARITASGTRDRSEAQLSGLVRANLVRGGRGVLSAEDAETISAVEGVDAAESLIAFDSTVRALFVGSTADRLSRTVQLLTTLFEDEPSQAELDRIRQEPLSDSELSVVLPFVLDRATNVTSPAVWTALGSLITLQRLESLAATLQDVDLTPLIVPIVGSVQGARSTVAHSSEELTPQQLSDRPATWRMRSSMLSAAVGPWDFFVGSTGRKIRGRDDGPDARWDELSEPLDHFELKAASLRGLTRHLDIAGENPREVREDIRSIRTSIQDDFHVPSVTVQEDQDELSTVTVDFGAMTLNGKASVAFHLRAAGLLARKQAFTPDALKTLLGTEDYDAKFV